MGDACCGGSHPANAFRCQGCGHCCEELRGRWQRDRGRFDALPGTPLVRLSTDGGLRLFAWEATAFPSERLVPLLVVPDARRGRFVAVAYELDADRCPNFGEDGACGIYDERPLVCRAYPLLLVDNEDGPEVAVSKLCPSRVPVVAAAEASARPKRVVAGLYPHEAAAALAVPMMVAHAARIVDHLVSADLMEPVTDMDEAAIAAWTERGAISLLDVIAESGAHTADGLREHARDVLDQVARHLA